MSWSKRERYFGIGVGAVIGLFTFDSVFFTPLNDRLALADARVKADADQLATSGRLIDNSLRARRRWQEVARDSVKDDAPGAESQALNRVREWAQGAGVSLTSLKPTRGESAKGFDRIIVQATGTGSTAQVARFLHSLQTATIPLRVTDLELSARKEGTDDLAMQVTIATIYASANTTAAGPNTAVRPGTTGGR